MKKTFEGKFCDIYYNDCEAGFPLAIQIGDKKQNLCDIIKDSLEIDLFFGHEEHKFLNKKVKITIEIEE